MAEVPKGAPTITMPTIYLGGTHTDFDAIINVRIDDTPYADDPKTADDFYRALGRYIVAWGRFEGHFLGCLLTIRSLALAPNQTNGFPVSWKKRAEYWRAAFKEMPQLRPLQSFADKLLIEIMDHAQSRHGFIHSMWRGFLSPDPVTIEALSVRPKTKEVEMKREQITIAKLDAARGEANRLNRQLATITSVLSGLRPRPTKGSTFL